VPLLDGLLKRFVKVGSLKLTDASGQTYHYEGAPGRRVSVRLTDPSLSRKLFFNPELHAGEAYMNGTLILEEGGIRDFLTLFAENSGNLRSHPIQKIVRGAMKRFKRFKQRNTTSASSANVRHHYDLSNAFYTLWLDEDMHYSCAYFVNADDTLEQAQQNKLRHITAKLDVKPGMRVLAVAGAAMRFTWQKKQALKFWASHCQKSSWHWHENVRRSVALKTACALN
jgi:cyclopropane-fatty-acyl-phospholipid synthase